MDLPGGALPALNGALEVALVVGAGVLAGEVDAALRPAGETIEARVLAGQVGRVGAVRDGARPPVVHPGVPEALGGDPVDPGALVVAQDRGCQLRRRGAVGGLGAEPLSAGA